MTYGAILIEFCLAFLLWFRAARLWTIFAGLALHIGILVTVNIPIFGELITACYLTFLTPEELDVMLARLDPRGWLSRLTRLSPDGLTRADVPSRLRGAHRVVTDCSESAFESRRVVALDDA